MAHTLCVFTPTFNRAYTLPKLYRSLLRQSCSNFYWLIVDDGSTDDTERVIHELVNENKLLIKYIRTVNGGKQRAWNIGVDACDAELFMCVDSDDYLAEDSIPRLLQTWTLAKRNPENAGVVTPRFPRNKLFPDHVSLTFGDLYKKYGYQGETCFATRTSILKQHPFVVAEGEKFIPEVYVFDQIDRKHKHFALNKEVCLGEYLPDGYTSRYKQILLANPKSYSIYKKQCIDLAASRLTQLKEVMLYLSWSFIAKASIIESIKGLNGTAGAALLILPAFILAQLIKLEFKQ